ncbi:hypothetical protein GQ457_06G013370 [Hibiscus cannabinus]
MSERIAKQSEDNNPSLGWMDYCLPLCYFKLTYPSGTATAHLINSFHTPQGAKLAKKQVKALGKLFSVSFLWGFFQWFFTAGDDCGFVNFPTFGITAYNKFYFDFSAKYAGRSRDDLSSHKQHAWPPRLQDQIPTWFSVAGYVTIAVISTILLPHLFRDLKWYYILVISIFASTLAFCNAYGCGLTSTYGKLAIFTIGAWAGSHGGVLAGLVACGVMMDIVSTASDLMQDFKTGYLTLASPRSMFISQVIGTAMSCA